MKNVLILILLFTASLGSLSAQSYRSSQFVGDWEVGNSEIYLAESGSAKVTFNNGTSSWGKWFYSSYFGNAVTISLNTGLVLDLDVVSVSTNKIVLDYAAADSRYSLVRKSSTRNNSNEEVIAVVGAVATAAFLVWLFSDDSNDTPSSYDQEEYERQQRMKKAGEEKQAEYDRRTNGY